MKFKIGNTIRVTRHPEREMVGKMGRVREVHPSYIFPYRVELYTKSRNGDTMRYFSERKLELAFEINEQLLFNFMRQ